MDFTRLTRRSFDLIWKQKSLWLFGFFAMAGGGAAANSQVTRQGSGGTSALPTWLWPALAIAAVLGVIALVMHVVSEAALIDGARRADATEAVSVSTGLASGRRHFWRVVGIKALLGAASGAAVLVMAAPAALALFHVLPGWAAVAATLPLVVLGVPVLLSLQFVTLYALRVAVVDDVGVREAVTRGKAHLEGRVLDSVKLMLVAFLAQAAGVLVTLTSLVPGAAAGVAVWALTSAVVPAVVTGVVLSAPLAAVALGATGALRSTVWTLGFLEGRAEAQR